MSERIWYLKHCELWEQLSTERLARLERACKQRCFSAKTPVYLPADAADAVFLVADGVLKVCHLTVDGKASTIALVTTGELFGELALFDPGERGEYVEALTTTTVIRIPVGELQALMREDHDVALRMTKFVGLRRQRIERRLRNLLFLPNRPRLIHLLLDLAEQFGAKTEEGVHLAIKLSHHELANLIGSTRETVTNLLGELKQEGLILTRRQTIVLVHPERLAASVNR